MEKALFFLLTIFPSILFFQNSANAQFSLGVSKPNPSAILDITDSTRGTLIPRMTTIQRNAINSPAKGLMIFNTSTNQINFFQDSTWGETNFSALVDLEVSKTDNTQSPAVANATNTGDVITFNNVIKSPRLGMYNASTSTYTVGISGFYYIQVRSVSLDDNSSANTTTGHWFKVEIDPFGSAGPSFVNSRDLYGSFPTLSASNFPTELKGRSDLQGVVYLNAGDSFVIKGLSASSNKTAAIKSDGSCRLTVVKL